MFIALGVATPTLYDFITLTVVACFEQIFFVDDRVGPSYLIHEFIVNITY